MCERVVSVARVPGVIFCGARCRGAFVDGCVVWAGVHEVSSVWCLPFGRDALTCWLVGGLLCCLGLVAVPVLVASEVLGAIVLLVLFALAV